MNVIEIMTVSPITIRSDQSLYDAVELMHQHDIKHLPVVSDHHLVGVVTSRDCLYALNRLSLLDGSYDQKVTRHVMVRSMMSSEVIVVEPDTPAIEAVEFMLTYRIGCLPVLREETLVGIVTRSDVLVAYMILQRRFDRMPDGLLVGEAQDDGDSF